MRRFGLWLGGVVLLVSGGCLPDNFWADQFSGSVETFISAIVDAFIVAVGLAQAAG